MTITDWIQKQIDRSEVNWKHAKERRDFEALGNITDNILRYEVIMEATKEFLEKAHYEKDVLNVIVDEGGTLPTRAHQKDAAVDLYSPKDFVIYPRDHVTIGAKIHTQIKPHTAGFIVGRSSVTTRGVVIPVGVVDTDYTGEVGITMFNLTDERQEFKAGERIAQLVTPEIWIPEVRQVESFEKTERGDNGFGSTGR